MVTTTTRAKKMTSAAAPAPTKRTRAPLKKRAAPTTGPLTLEQARGMVGASADSSAPGESSRRAPPIPTPTVATSANATPATVAIERRKLAIRDREERKRRLRDYKATFALLQSRGVQGLPPPARGDTARSGPLRVLAEGDSWFDYPVPFFGGSLIPRLETRLGIPILNLAKAGDETRFMLGVEQRKLIARHLRDGSTDGTPWELMLFSGGGNDIVAQPLALWLRDFDPALAPAKLIHQPRFTSALALIRAAYEDLIALRDSLSPQTHLAFHGYDFAIPDGRGICNLGPWLKPAFDVRGFPANMTASTAVVREMLVQFAAMLKSLEARPRVTAIVTQGTLAAVPASWHNEMHPTKAGFEKMADKFHGAIKVLFPGRVLA